MSRTAGVSGHQRFDKLKSTEPFQGLSPPQTTIIENCYIRSRPSPGAGRREVANRRKSLHMASRRMLGGCLDAFVRRQMELPQVLVEVAPLGRRVVHRPAHAALQVDDVRR